MKAEKTRLAVEMFRRGITQEYLGELLGVQKQNINPVIQGKKSVDKERAEAITRIVMGKIGPFNYFWRKEVNRFNDDRFYAKDDKL